MTTILARLFSRIPKARRRQVMTQMLRRGVQVLFLVFIVSSAVIHNLATTDGATPSIDALCPFGGLETLWQYIITGQYVPKTHPSNIVLGLGLLIGTLLAGSAFCGWICPFGTLQDFLAWVRKKLHLPTIKVPAMVDRILRFGRYLALAVILYNTIATVKLWFGGWDPYRTIFGLEWLFEFNWAVNWIAYTSAGVVLLASLFVERAWCRYACPLGGTLSLLGNLSLLRIRRDEAKCKGCAICDKACPVALPVATPKIISANCIGCLNCVESCPLPQTLEVRLQPAWLPAPAQPKSKPEAPNAR
jgi:polyferredoxin